MKDLTNLNYHTIPNTEWFLHRDEYGGWVLEHNYTDLVFEISLVNAKLVYKYPEFFFDKEDGVAFFRSKEVFITICETILLVIDKMVTDKSFYFAHKITLL